MNEHRCFIGILCLFGAGAITLSYWLTYIAGWGNGCVDAAAAQLGNPRDSWWVQLLREKKSERIL